MPATIRTLILFSLLCALPMAVSSCGVVQGAKDVSTDVGGDAEGHGPGLFSGKEGGFVIYNDVWGGSVPGGGVAE